MIINKLKGVNMAPQSKFSSIWETGMDDEPMDSHVELEPHVIDDDLEDLLNIGDDVDDDTSLGLVDHEMDDDSDFSRHTIFRPDPPATPSPEGSDTEESYADHFVREVTPDQKKAIVTMEIDDVRLPGLEELREEYKLCQRRLSETIKHAEMTRRWRARFSDMDEVDDHDEALVHAIDFLCGARSTLTADLEVSRRKLWDIIHSPPPTEF